MTLSWSKIRMTGAVVLYGGNTMTITCTAIVENPQQRNNLCECIEILGGVPSINKEAVSVTLSRDDAKAEKFIELFEHYVRHEIHYE